MTLKPGGVPAQLADDDTTYENICISPVKEGKLTCKAKSLSPREASTKTAKSLLTNEAPLLIASNSKPHKGLSATMYGNHKSKTMKFMATTLFLGLLVLVIALALVLYFMVVKKNDDKPSPKLESNSSKPKSATTTAISLPHLEMAPEIPGPIDPRKGPCYVVTQWLPEFDFVTYGKHATKTMGYFVTLKNEYFKQRKRINNPSLNKIVEEGRNLIRKMLTSLEKMKEVHYHGHAESNHFEDYVREWLNCTANKKVDCDSIELKLTEIMEAYKYEINIIGDICIKIATTFRKFSDLLKAEPRFFDMANLLSKYLEGFIAFCKSLERIISTVFPEHLETSDHKTHFPIFEECKEYACLVIAERAMDFWSSPNAMLKAALSEHDDAAFLNYWEDHKVAQVFRNISDGFTNDSIKQTTTFLTNENVNCN